MEKKEIMLQLLKQLYNKRGDQLLISIEKRNDRLFHEALVMLEKKHLIHCKTVGENLFAEITINGEAYLEIHQLA